MFQTKSIFPVKNLNPPTVISKLQHHQLHDTRQMVPNFIPAKIVSYPGNECYRYKKFITSQKAIYFTPSFSESIKNPNFSLNFASTSDVYNKYGRAREELQDPMVYVSDNQYPDYRDLDIWLYMGQYQSEQSSLVEFELYRGLLALSVPVLHFLCPPGHLWNI